MASTADIRNGLCIKFNHDIYKIVEFLHVKPGKGPAFVRTKLKSLTTGKVLDNTFSAGHKIDTVRVETHTFQYLYSEGSDFHFMNTETFEQITLNKDVLDAPELLKEALNTVTEEHLAAESPLKSPIGDFTFGGTVAFLAQHESYDIGQMAFLKKYHTKVAMKY